MPLKTLVWSLYNAEEVPAEDAEAYCRFHSRVRAAVVAEIATRGDKRPLIDIVYDVAGGLHLEQALRSKGGALSKAMLLNSMAGEMSS